MLLYAYLLVAVGLGLAALSLLQLLLSAAPLVWGGEGGSSPSVAGPARGVVLGLGVAGVGLGLLRLRMLQPSSKVSGLEKGRTGWALAAGVVVGVAIAGGTAYMLVRSDGSGTLSSADATRAPVRPDTVVEAPLAE